MSTYPLRRNLSWLFSGCWLLLSLAGATLQAARNEEYAGESAKWRRYQSPNFELFSANGDGASRDLLHNMELLRALFFDNFKLKERQPLNVTIYYFKDKDDFFKYVSSQQRQNENLAGYYLSRPDRATIVVSPTWDDESARHIIFHEYVHHLIRISGEDPPLWYNEGVAELYSSIEIGPNALEIGKPLPWHIGSLRSEKFIPFETLFAVSHGSPIYNTGTHTGQFYAESWALLHYWYYGRTKLDHDRIGAFMRYIRNETGSADPELRRLFFQNTMGMDYPAMQALLENYAQNGSYGWKKLPLPQIPEAKSYDRRELALSEMRAQLAELDLRANQSGKARLALLRTAEDEAPAKVRAWEVLGSDAWVQGETDLMRERWQRAIDLGTSNPAIYHEMGLMETKRWFGTFDYYFRMPAERATQLRTLLKRSIECAPEQSEAYEMLAWVEATAAKPNIGNVNLVQARFATLVSKGPTLVALALVRAHLNDRNAALKILDQADATNPGPALAEVVRTIRVHLQSEADRAANDAAATSPDPAGAIPTLSDPSHGGDQAVRDDKR